MNSIQFIHIWSGIELFYRTERMLHYMSTVFEPNFMAFTHHAYAFLSTGSHLVVSVIQITSFFYQYSKVRYGTTPGGRFLRSDSHRAIQEDIFARLLALSTFTVATMRAQSSESAKHVSSKNELGSETGTPNNCALAIEPRALR